MLRDAVREDEPALAGPVAAGPVPRVDPDGGGSAGGADGTAGAVAGLQATAGNAATATLLAGDGTEAPATGPAQQAQQALLTRLAAARDAAQARLTAAVDSAEAAIGTAVSEQQQAVDAALHAALGEAESHATAARGRVTGAAGSAEAALEPAAAAQQAGLETWRAGAVATATGQLLAGQVQVRAAGQTRAAQARTDAEAAATTAGAEAGQQAAQARATGDARAAAATGDEEPIRRAKADAARELAGRTASTVETGARDAATTMREQGEQAATALEEGATGLADGLPPQLDTLTTGLTGQAEQAGTAMTGVVTQGRQALADQQGSALTALDGTRSGAVAALRQTAAARRAAVARLGEQATARLRAGAAEAGQALTGQVAEASRLLAARPMDEATAAELGDAAEQQLGAAADQLGADLTGWAGTVAEELAGVPAEATEALGATGGHAAGAFTQTAQAAGTALAQTGESAQGALAATGEQARTAGEAGVTAFGTDLDARIADAGTTLDPVLTEHGTRQADLTAQLRTPATEAATSLPQRITEGQQRAADKADRGWLSRQLGDLWDMVSSPEFWVGLLVGLAVAVIIIGTAGTATPFVIMAAGIAAGAAGAAAGTITHNVRTGQEWDKDLVHNTLVGAAAGGAAAGVFLFGGGVIAGAGLTGMGAAAAEFAVVEVAAVAANTVSNLASGQPWDKNLLAAMLLAPLIARAARALGPKEGPPPPEETEPANQPGGRMRGCFAPGTPVLTPEGARPIESLQAGDLVLAYDIGTGTLVTQPVLATLGRQVPVVLELAVGADAITCSPEHPFWVADEARWCEAGSLQPGAALLAADGSTVKLDTVRPLPAGRWPVHNLTVAGTSTYFVSRTGILVHNKGANADPPELAAAKSVADTELHGLRNRVAAAQDRAQQLPPGQRQAALAKLTEIAECLENIQDNVSAADSPDTVRGFDDWRSGLASELAELEGTLPELPPTQAEPEPVEPEPAEPEPAEPTSLEDVNPTDQSHWPDGWNAGPAKEAIPGMSGSDAATDIPSWAEGAQPRVGESGEAFARRLMGYRYPRVPERLYPKGPGSDWSKLQKYVRGYRDPE